MTTSSHVEKCLSFLHSQMQPASSRAGGGACAERLAITISRETGTGGLAIAHKLAKRLEKHGPCPGKPWTVFDKNLVGEVLKEHNLPEDFARFMDERRTNELESMVEEILGLHPSSWELVRRVTETMLHLADLGHVILVGRGGNIITRPIDHAFHVRFVGSTERRIERLRDFEKVSEKAARPLIEESEEARRRYVKKHFKKDIADPLLYDLVVNTDRIKDEDAARLIAEASMTRCR